MSIFDDDFDFDDIIESDIEYGFFEEDDKIAKQNNQEEKSKNKKFFLIKELIK